MFWLNWISGLVSVVCLVAIFLIISFGGPTKDWGDVSQALMWHQVRKYILLLDDKKHAKFWRPSYLLLCHDIGKHSLIDFCERSKKGGLFLIGNVMVGDVFALAQSCRNLRHKWVEQIRGSHIKALPKVTIAPSTRLGYQFLMTSAGVGGLDFNTVVLPLDKASRASAMSLSFPPSSKNEVEDDNDESKENPSNSDKSHTPRSHLKTLVGKLHADLDCDADFMSTVQDALRLERNVLLAANFKVAGLVANEPKSFIDVWLGTGTFLQRSNDDHALKALTSETTGALMLHIAFILNSNQKFCKESRLRVFKILPSSLKHHRETVEAELLESLRSFRISVHSAECVVVSDTPSRDGPDTVGDNFSAMAGTNGRLYALAEKMHRMSSKQESCVVFASIQDVSSSSSRDVVDGGFFENLSVLSNEKAMPAMLFCEKGEQGKIIYEYI